MVDDLVAAGEEPDSGRGQHAEYLVIDRLPAHHAETKRARFEKMSFRNAKAGEKLFAGLSRNFLAKQKQSRLRQMPGCEAEKTNKRGLTA